MYQKLKAEMKEIIEIVKQCPESLQEKCFELLLENYLSAYNSRNGDEKKTIPLATENKEPAMVKPTSNDSSEEKTTEDVTSEEITMKDFHVRVKRFLDNNGITIDQINYLYYKEDEAIKPLYDSLNSTSMAECQIRLALLTAFENSFTDPNGEMSFNCEAIRTKCIAMKCYNGSNFTSYFKNNSNLWDNWPDKYDKGLNIVLSNEGKKELAKVLLDLAKDE